GDWISLDCDSGALNLEVDDAEIARRLAEADPMAASNQIATTGGYRQLYIERVLQADEGCDFDFLRGCRGAEVPRHSH
ncbi:MAG: dihydroxy-acid dehydratase, partial [Pseudomonadota bacterium]|nr:dihydroxy-acid dehydratase [Pseudomonadota bacterium]